MTERARPFTSQQQIQALAALNERTREIFRQIVESYLTTGEPMAPVKGAARSGCDRRGCLRGSSACPV